ncbi:hypothetical protein ES705_42209 [subsurface metagenome]
MAGRPRPIDELSIEEELDYPPAEALGDLLEVGEGDVDETAVLIKAAFQDDGVPVRIPPQELAKGLVLEFILHLLYATHYFIVEELCCPV